MSSKSRPYKSPAARFVISSPSLELCPDLDGQPELAMVGRSNVGKSSFINKLCKRKRIAHTSNTPGKTRLINYYMIEESWSLVDLPGYGYAKVSKTEQSRWQRTLEEFLLERTPLIGVLQLIDSRHGAQPNDKQMNRWLMEAGVNVAVVMTKTDKAKKSQLAKMAASVRKDLERTHGFFTFSAETGEGAEELWWALKEWREGRQAT